MNTQTREQKRNGENSDSRGDKFYAELSSTLGRNPTAQDVEALGSMTPYHLPTLDSNGDNNLALRLESLRESNNLSDREMSEAIHRYNQSLRHKEEEKLERRERTRKASKAVLWTAITGIALGSMLGTAYPLATYTKEAAVQNAIQTYAQKEKVLNEEYAKKESSLATSYAQKEEQLKNKFYGSLDALLEVASKDSSLTSLERELTFQLHTGISYQDNTASSKITYSGTHAEGKVKVIAAYENDVFTIYKLNTKNELTDAYVYNNARQIIANARPLKSLHFREEKTKILNYEKGHMVELSGNKVSSSLFGVDAVSAYRTHSAKVLSQLIDLLNKGGNSK